MTTTNATLTRRTTLTLIVAAAPCDLCRRLYAPTDLLYSLTRDNWRCRDWQRCHANRAESARIAAELREQGREAA